MEDLTEPHKYDETLKLDISKFPKQLELPESYNEINPLLQIVKNNPNLDPTSKILVDSVSKLDSKQDWLISAIRTTYTECVDSRTYLKSITKIINNHEKWKEQMDEWKTNCNNRLDEAEKITNQVKDEYSKHRWLKELLTTVITTITTLATATLTLWAFGEKIIGA